MPRLCPSRSSVTAPSKTGRGGGIRTPTSGFGDRRSTVEPTPLNSEVFSEFTLSRFSAKGSTCLSAITPASFLVSNPSVPLRALVRLPHSRVLLAKPAELGVFDLYVGRRFPNYVLVLSVLGPLPHPHTRICPCTPACNKTIDHLFPSTSANLTLQACSSAGERAPMSAAYFTSLCGVCFRHVLQNFDVSSRSGCFLRFFMVV